MASALRTAPSSARGIEDDLAALWRDVAADGSVSRASMSNLVAVSDAAGEHPVDALLKNPLITQVARLHPARVIALEYGAGASQPCGPSTASVGVLTFGSNGPRYGIEMIAVQVACVEASLPSIVRRLTRGDVPTTIWWMSDLSVAASARVLLTLGQQLLYDSREWRQVADGFSLLEQLIDSGRRPDLADLNWRRLQPLRDRLENYERSSPVRLKNGQPTAASWLLAGWLRTRGIPVTFDVDGLEAADMDEDYAAAVAAELHSLQGDHELRQSIKAARLAT
jgi:hypothetical protein